MAKNVNFKQFGAELRRATVSFQKEVEYIVDANIGDMELMATRLAPGPGKQIETQGGSENEFNIRQSKSAKGSVTPVSQAIGSVIDRSKLKGSVFVEKSAGPFAIWIEFGTGQSAASYVPTLPPEMQAIARKYYINGKGTIVNQPYLLPAFMKYKEQFLSDLKEAISNFGKTI